MRSRRNHSQDRNDLRRYALASILNEEFMSELNTLQSLNTLHDELKQAVREEIKTALHAELDDHITKLESQINKLSSCIKHVKI